MNFKIYEKIKKTFPRKKRDTTFSQPLRWILCEGRLAKKSDRILQKNLLKNIFWNRFYNSLEFKTVSNFLFKNLLLNNKISKSI